MNDITNKASQNEVFLPINFAITTICVEIRLAEKEQEWVVYSFNYPLVNKVLIVIVILFNFCFIEMIHCS